jgi:hypothetical protein
MNIEKIKAWATTDEKGNVIALCETRREARSQLRYAKRHGHTKFKLVKLSFDSFQR